MLTLALLALQAKGVSSDGYSLTPFDESRKALPLRFLGHSIVRIGSAASKLNLRRSQYESTDDFELRKKRAKAKPLFGAVSGTSVYAVLVPVGTAYDADNERVNALVRLQGLEDAPSLRSYRLFPKGFQPTFARNTYLGSFVGSNSFGVKRKVRRYGRTEVSLVFDNLDEWGLGFQSDRRSASSPEPNTIMLTAGLHKKIAPLVKPRLLALAVFTLTEPVLSWDVDTDKATLDDPVEQATTRYFLGANVRSIWLYDYKTGTVYARVKAE